MICRNAWKDNGASKIAVGVAIAILTLVLAGGGTETTAYASQPPSHPSVARVSPSDVAHPAGPDLARFFCLNAITPFHHRVSDDPAVREGMWDILDKQLAIAKDLGTSHIRVDMWWGLVEPEPGEFDLEFTDRIIDAIVAAGLEPFPIFCYNAADSPDQSPSTPEQFEAFGNYVHTLVERYKDRVRIWEVWNEPNITPFWVPRPDPELYVGLLRVANARAKEADPTCTIVAFCTAGADYAFIEGGYRHGAAGHFDALSFHHYGDLRREEQLESEIRQIRRLMERYGDGDKPILITEIGLSTGPTPIARPYSPEDQAVWMVKKHMLSIAGGIDGFYWFKMLDDATETDPDGYWGLLRYDYAEKPSALAYRHMAHLCSGATFIGRAHRIATLPDRRNDAECLIFQKDGEVFACAWVRNDGGPLSVLLPADSLVRMEALNGSLLRELAPNAEGFVDVPLSRVPSFIRGLSPRAIPLASIRFETDPLYLAPGETKTVDLVVVNPLADPLSIDLRDLKTPHEKGGLRVAVPGDSVQAAAETVTRIPVTFTLPPDAPRFTAQEFSMAELGRYAYGLRIEYVEPIHLRLQARTEGHRGSLVAQFTNSTAAPLSGTIHWKLRDEEVFRPTPFLDLQPGASASTERRLGPALGAIAITASAATETGAKVERTIGAYGQPMLKEAPVLDGNLQEWRSLPGIELTPTRHLVRPKDKAISPDDFRGTVKVAWTNSHLFLAADVVDATPFVNPHEETELWRGDSMEIYLGFDGPTFDTSYGERHFQLGIHPGGDGREPHVWNWRAKAPVEGEPPPEGGARIDDARVVVVPTAKGYAVEAAIPLAALGIASVHPNQFIGFDVSLNNLDDPDGDINDAVLTWNGHGTGWRDPSTWGFAVIMP